MVNYAYLPKDLLNVFPINDTRNMQIMQSDLTLIGSTYVCQKLEIFISNSPRPLSGFQEGGEGHSNLSLGMSWATRKNWNLHTCKPIYHKNKS